MAWRLVSFFWGFEVIVSDENRSFYSVLLLGIKTALGLTEINSVGNFTALRFVQGFFGAAPVVLSGALLRDLFSRSAIQVMSPLH